LELILKVAQILTQPFFYPGRCATTGRVMIADLKDQGLVTHGSLPPFQRCAIQQRRSQHANSPGQHFGDSTGGDDQARAALTPSSQIHSGATMPLLASIIE
jgi:hypothetical protein